MDDLKTLVFMIILFTLLTILLFRCSRTAATSLPLPPGPPGLPLVGSLPFLSANLHRCFADYARTYGPIMKLRIGTKLYIVISSPELAKEVYRENDIVFANHSQSVATRVVSYGGSNLVRCPYGETWRVLRRVFRHELLNCKIVDAYSDRRQREVERMVHKLYTKRGTPVNVGEEAFATFLNLLTSMTWGGTLEWDENGAGSMFRQAATEAVDIMGKLNLSDIIPGLAWFDLQGIERKIKKSVSSMDSLYSSIIEERLKSTTGAATEEGSSEMEGNCERDFLSILLKIKESRDSETPLTMNNLKGLITDMVLGGTSVTTTTVEWVMAELMHRPDVKQRAQHELQTVVGLDQAVNESHVSKLHYLQAVIRESIRLHAVVPLLVPRVPSQPCTVGGYLIPKGAHVVTNVWAIHMDPRIWDNPSEFQPERFLKTGRVKEFSFFPFGSGKRKCAGLPLVERMLPLVVATMLHMFEWELPEGVEFDLCERQGVTLTKERPVLAVPIPRSVIPALHD